MRHRVSAANDARERLEAAIWGVYNTGSVAPPVRVDAALRAAEKYAEAVADERIAGRVTSRSQGRERLQEAVAEIAGRTT